MAQLGESGVFMNIAFVDLKAQYDSIREHIDQAIAQVIQDAAFIGGRYVKTFEEHFAEFLGINHCIGLANGTDALFIAMQMRKVRAIVCTGGKVTVRIPIRW